MTNISLYKIFTFNVILIFFLIIFSKDLMAGAGSKEIDEIQVNKNPLEINEKNIAKGKKQWRKAGCYSCHGGMAEGGVGPSLQDDVWVYKPTDKMLFKTISKGRSGTVMVGWEAELSQTEIWEVIVFIRSLYNGDKSKIIW